MRLLAADFNEGGAVRISIGADHAGFRQKQMLFQHLIDAGHEVLDRGPHNEDRVDYPDYACLVAQDVADGKVDFGVLICGTGIGMAIAANKVCGIRAVNITNEGFAALARQHNDANVLTLSGRFITFGENCKIVDTFLNTEFEGGRHCGRVDKISELEQRCLASSQKR